MGLCLNPARAEARAAWYSFGFLVRRAAAVSLESMSRSSMSAFSQSTTRQVRLRRLQRACLFLTAWRTVRVTVPFWVTSGTSKSCCGSSSGNRATLDARVSGSLLPWPAWSSQHESSRAGSCHRCLREFGNMAYHALLDWRLGLDMARLALDPHAPIDLSIQLLDNFSDTIAAAYFGGLGLTQRTVSGLRVGVNPYTSEAIVLIHPLWDQNSANYRPDVAAAVAQIEAEGLTPKLRSLLRAVRFPYRVESRCKYLSRRRRHSARPHFAESV